MPVMDFVNGLFEFFGSFAIGLSVLKLLKDKRVAGVSWLMVAFFASWGAWNLAYYPSLGQWWSFGAGIGVCTVNLIYMGQLIYYTRCPGGKKGTPQ